LVSKIKAHKKYLETQIKEKENVINRYIEETKNDKYRDVFLLEEL
jgi:hypothetical protein